VERTIGRADAKVALVEDNRATDGTTRGGDGETGARDHRRLGRRTPYPAAQTVDVLRDQMASS
jgi:hypothetical protein